MKSATSEGLGCQVPTAAEAGRLGPSAQVGAWLTLRRILRPLADASRTAGWTEEKSYSVLAGFVGSAGLVAPDATAGHSTPRRTMPAPASAVRPIQRARSESLDCWYSSASPNPVTRPRVAEAAEGMARAARRAVIARRAIRRRLLPRVSLYVRSASMCL